MPGQHANPMYPLRIPADLRKRADAAAAADHRSLNNWILALIEREVRSVTKPVYRNRQGILEIKLPQFGPAHQCDAAHIVGDLDSRNYPSGSVIHAAVLEPVAREGEWPQEDAFRAAVIAQAQEIAADRGQTVCIQWEPGSDHTEELYITADGVASPEDPDAEA